MDFSLKPDNIIVKLVGTIGSEIAEPITSLKYLTLNSEEISILYYRGYATDDQTVVKTYNYTINRKDLVSYVINVNDVLSSDIISTIFINSNNIISFNNGIGSIGTIIKPLYSRLPTSNIPNKTLNMPITISSDSVKITRTSSETGISSSITKLLQDYKLYTFLNGENLMSLNLRANWSTAKIGDYYLLNYGKANMSIYHNNNYIGNPQDITETDWEKISEVSFSEAKNGFKISGTKLDADGFLTVSTTDDIRVDSESFFVCAGPQMKATQLTINGAKVLPFDTTDTSMYDENELITTYFPITSELETTEYNPFIEINNLNNVTFTSINKNFADYNDSTKNIIDDDFIISGSTIQIQEVKPNGEPTKAGADKNGIIFDGTIDELLLMDSTNKYYRYIQLDSKNNNVLNLSYTQENNAIFETVFVDTKSKAKPLNNIKFSINGYFIKEPDEPYKLISSMIKSIKTNIYDMIKRESDIILLKYECLNIDFTNIPGDIAIKKISFFPTKVYTSIVTMPDAQFGNNYLKRFNTIALSNMSLDTSGNIIWDELFSSTLLDNFSLSITAVNQKGLQHIIELLYTTSEIPINFSVINQTNVMEILAIDGTPKFVITPFGQIIAPNINVNALTILYSVVNNNVDYMGSNANLF